MLRLVLLFVCVFSAHQCQRNLDAERFSSVGKKERYFLPNAKLLKAGVMGHDEAAADLLWIRSILISADFIENCEKKEGDWLYTMLQAIVHLEPKWKSVYHYGGLMMDLCDNIDGSDALYKQGFSEFPQESRFAFLLSTNASNHHDDVDRALYWMQKAASVPNAAPWYSAAVAGLIKKGDGLDSSILYLEQQLETMPPSVLRDFTEERYRLLVHDSLVPKIENLRQKFIQATGRNPKTVEELHIPVPDPYEVKGGRWVLSADGHIRSSIIETKAVRKAQVSEKELLRLAK